MGNHIRKQIRDAVKAALSRLDSTGPNVFSGRVSPLKDSELPGLLIYLNGDDGENGPNTGGGPTAEHVGVLRVEGICSANDETIDLCDQIEVEVVTALFASEAFLALLQFPPLAHSSTIQIDDPVGGVGRRLGSVVISLPIQYRTALGDPTTQV